MSQNHNEHHYLQRSGWLRAAVLGANDGLVSTASLLMGLSAGSTDRDTLLFAGGAALVAGAMSMAAGEFVSVSSQTDIETADRAIEEAALKGFPDEELEELAGIYVARGVEPAVARQVAEQLMAHDALDAHLRDELGLVEGTAAQPLVAAAVSGVSFAVGAGVPLLAATVAPAAQVGVGVAVSALVGMVGIAVASGWAGGGVRLRAVGRLVLWGTAAMVVTWIVGASA